MNKKIYEIFKWDSKELIQNFIGLTIFCIGINLFVEPNHLYSGGVLGLAQLINYFINNFFNTNLYLTNIFYFLINIPLLLMA